MLRTLCHIVVAWYVVARVAFHAHGKGTKACSQTYHGVEVEPASIVCAFGVAVSTMRGILMTHPQSACLHPPSAGRVSVARTAEARYGPIFV